MMASTIRGRVFKGLGASGFNQLVSVAIQLISLPILLQFWKAEVYGDWLTLLAIPSFLAMSDLGFGAVTSSEMSMLVAEGNYEMASETFQSSLAFTFIISIVFMLFICVFIYIFPVANMLNVHAINPNATIKISILLGIYSALLMYDTIIGAAYTCNGNYSKHLMYTGITRLLETIAVVVVVLMGAMPTLAATSLILTRAIAYAWKCIALKRSNPWISYGFSKAKILTIKRLAGPAITFMGFPFGNIISLQGITIIINIMRGPTTVVLFTTLRTLSRIAFQILAAINRVIWPEISAAFGSNNLELARRLHRKACQASVWLSLAIIAVLYFTGPWIIRLWTHGGVEYDPVVFHILLIQVFANSLWYSSLVALVATNKHSQITLIYLVLNVLGIGLATVSSRRYGIEGIACSLAFVDVVMVYFTVKRSLAILNDRYSSFLESMIPKLTNILDK